MIAYRIRTSIHCSFFQSMSLPPYDPPPVQLRSSPRMTRMEAAKAPIDAPILMPRIPAELGTSSIHWVNLDVLGIIASPIGACPNMSKTAATKRIVASRFFNLKER